MRLPRTRKHVRVELLPLLDVVFLLLVFLIYAMMSMTVHTGMPVNLPASQSALPERKAFMALTIQANGALWLDKNPVSLENLAAEVMRKSRGLPEGEEPAMQIFADALLPYQKLFDVLDVLKKAGLQKISLQARE